MVALQMRREPGLVARPLTTGGFLMSPHTLASDTVLLAFAMLAGGATPWRWWILSALGLAVALLHAVSVSTFIGLALAVFVGWGLLTRPTLDRDHLP